MKYEYLATEPDLPPPSERRPHMRESPMMDSDEMTWWLNKMAGRGWEFVGYGQKQWVNCTPQEWWVFRRQAPQGVD